MGRNRISKSNLFAGIPTVAVKIGKPSVDLSAEDLLKQIKREECRRDNSVKQANARIEALNNQLSEVDVEFGLKLLINRYNSFHTPASEKPEIENKIREKAAIYIKQRRSVKMQEIREGVITRLEKRFNDSNQFAHFSQHRNKLRPLLKIVNGIINDFYKFSNLYTSTADLSRVIETVTNNTVYHFITCEGLWTTVQTLPKNKRPNLPYWWSGGRCPEIRGGTEEEWHSKMNEGEKIVGRLCGLLGDISSIAMLHGIIEDILQHYVSYQSVCNWRRNWCKRHGITNHDCRTYRTQTARNMVSVN